MDVLWQVGTGIAAVILVIGAAFFWWWVPRWQMRSVTAGDPKARADIEDNFRKTVGQALGGVAVLIGAGMAYYGTQQTLQVNGQASHDLLISQQVAKGFEQLASDKSAMRLGGIYALEGIMNDPSPNYHQPVLEALCAFVRDGTVGMIINDGPATDIQAALTVIARRKDGSGRVNLINAILIRADLDNANLTGAILLDANLTRADLRDANLTGAILGRANLTGAYLFRANLTRAILAGAILTGATLTGADLTHAYLAGANLTNTNLTNAIVSQIQLDQACGVDAKLPPGLTLKPCPQ